MKFFVGDFLDELEHELTQQRRLAAHHVDRADALKEMRNRALHVSATQRRAITVEDVFDAAPDEHARAELQALADRITRDPGSEPPLGEEKVGGHHLETGASL